LQAIDQTISSSVWPIYRPSSRHLHCGTTTSVASGREQSHWEQQSTCSVPATPLPRGVHLSSAFSSNTCTHSIYWIQYDTTWKMALTCNTFITSRLYLKHVYFAYDTL